MNKKGLTLVELIVSLGLLSIILIFMVNLYANLRDVYSKSTNLKRLEHIKDLISTNITSDSNTYRLNSITQSGSTITFSYRGTASIPAFNKKLTFSSNKIVYECTSACNSELKITNITKTIPSNYKINSSQISNLSDIVKITLTIHDDDKKEDIPFIMFFYKYTGGAGGGMTPTHTDFPRKKLTDHVNDFASGKSKTSVNVINAETLSDSCTNTLAYDGTVDNNLRYVGANPCNFVKFNNEKWRIIGVMNNIESKDGKKESRIKLIRDGNIGYYSFSIVKYGTSKTGGTNDWSKSDLMKQLNGDYINYNLTEDTFWPADEGYYSSVNGKPYNHRFSLNKESYNLIDDALWPLGGVPLEHCDSVFYDCYHDHYNYVYIDTLKAKDAYIKEHGTEVWNGGAIINSYGTKVKGTCKDDACPRATSWRGKVGLMSLSDYGLSIGGSVRNTCLNTTFSKYNYEKSKCFYNTYIIDYKNTRTWTMTPISNSAIVNTIISSTGTPSYFYVGSGNDWSGVLTDDYSGESFNTTEDIYERVCVTPVVYLKSNVMYEKGLGSEENPIILGAG